MELPPLLRRNVDRALSGVRLADLAAAAAALSQRYRDEHHDNELHVRSERDALAYLAVRLPATYAAVRASFAAVAQARPDFAPKTLLDVGAGPGTALWAAADCWPDIADAMLLEASSIFRSCGEALARGVELPRLSWRVADIATGAIDSPACDVVSLAYVLNELAPAVREQVLKRLWDVTADTLVIVEPGTPAGWERVLAARRQLIDAGAHVLAPCPHACACPLQEPDWCHFAERVARSRLHRLAKEAEVPWEDEKFSYVALSRTPAVVAAPRVIARPRKGSGRVTLKLCRSDGSAGETLFSRRDGNAFKRAWRSDWGSQIDLDTR
ncbi:MAG: methyltransferase type 11 [Xanthobacteraceae bacterium]|nr:methyltransferase type 11 [Xanthobacteraceae bacterium]MBV9627013.1 methyltransferase type 11 [Xanthobacteraceae bacterium]